MIYGYLALVCLMANMACIVSGWRRISLPIVALEIVFGIVLGPTGFGLIPPTDVGTAANLEFMAQLGLIMLMFHVGTHLPFREPNIGKVLVVSGIATCLCFVFAYGVSLAICHFTGFAHVTILTLIMANSSAAVMMPMVRDKGLDGPVILAITLWVVMGDAVTIILSPAAMAPERLVGVATGTVAILVLAVVFFLAIKLFRATEYGQYIRERSKRNHHAFDLTQSLGVLFSLAFTAYLFHISFLVPGFAAGAIVALIGEPRRFTKQLIGTAEGLFVPIFFCTLGAGLNFRDLFHSIPNMELAVCIAVGAAIVHIAAALCVRLPVAGGLAAASQLGLPAAIASLGVASHMITSIEGAALVAASMLSVLICTAGTLGLSRYSVTPATERKPAELTKAHEAGHDE